MNEVASPVASPEAAPAEVAPPEVAPPELDAAAALAPHEPPPAALVPIDRILAELEQRVQMLEHRVATLQDTRQLEERITAHVVTRIPSPAPAPPPPSFVMTGADMVRGTLQSSWLLLDMLNEVRVMALMLFDRRYPMAWIARIGAIVLLIAFFTSAWWFPLSLLPIVGGPLLQIFDLFLILLLFLLISRESRRYREWRAGLR